VPGPDGTVSGCHRESFKETSWWVVGQAARPETPAGEAARQSLCRQYWWPVFFYLRRLGHTREDSEDLTQGFLARMLEKNYVRSAAREKGKFRSFLLVMLKRFVADERDRAERQKRGGGKPVVSLDAGDMESRSRLEPLDELTPEKAFERSWASSLLRSVLSSLEKERAALGKQSDFDELLPLITCDREDTCAGAARRLHWTEANVKVQVHRLRRRLGDMLRAEIAKTGATPAEIEEEIHALFSALS
jgi:RNA polymerase sigma-70 factor (ECF subfamily)